MWKGVLVLVLDGFKEETEPVAICNRKNDTNGALGACFSGDANYVIAGTDNNDVQIMDRTDGSIVNTLTGHIAPVNAITCNPVYDVMATGCLNTVLWIHSSGDGEEIQ